MWTRLADVLVHRRRACLALAALLTALAVPGALRIRFREDLTSLLPDGDPAVQAFRDVLESGLLTDSLVVLVEKQRPDVPTRTLTGFADAFAAELRGQPPVKDVRLSLASGVEGEEFAEFAADHLPFYLDDTGLEEFQRRISAEGMSRALASYRRRLERGLPMPVGAMHDPLGLHDLLRESLRRRWSAYTVSDDPRYRLSRDEQALLVIIDGRGTARETAVSRAIVAAAREAEARARERVAAAHGAPPAIAVSYAGGYAVAVESERVIKRDLTWTLITSIITVLFLFRLAFRGWTALAAAAVPLALGLLWTAGLAGWTWSELSPLTVALSAMLAGLAIDFPIHVYHAWQVGRSGDGLSDKAMTRALLLTGAPITTSATTTAAAFLALLLSSLPGLRELGTLAAAGLAFGWLATLLTLPSLALALDRGAADAAAQPGWLARLLDGAAGAATGRRRAILAGSALLGLASALFLLTGSSPGVPVENDLDRLRPSGDPTLRVQKRVQAVFGGGYDGLLLLNYGTSHQEALKEACSIPLLLDARVLPPPPGIAFAVEGPGSWVRISMAGLYHSVDVPRTLQQFDNVVLQSGYREEAFRDYRAWLERLLKHQTPSVNLLPAQILRRYVGASGSHAHDVGPVQNARQMFAVTHVRPLRPLTRADDREAFIAHCGEAIGLDTLMDFSLPRPGIWGLLTSLLRGAHTHTNAPPPVILTGPLVLTSRVERTVRAEAAQLAALVAVLVALCLLAHFRAVRPAAAALLPVAAGLLWTAALMKALDLRITPSNLMVFAWLIGIGIDNGVHLVDRVMLHGVAPDAAVRETGRALLMTGLTTIGGFGSLLFAVHPLVRSVGQVTALGVACMLVAALVVLPATLAARRVTTD